MAGWGNKGLIGERVGGFDCVEDIVLLRITYSNLYNVNRVARTMISV